MVVRVLLVDDEQLVCEGLANLLELKEGIAIVGSAENGQIAIPLVEQLSVDVVLMDVRMPVMDGIAATRHLQKTAPEVKILMLSTFNDLQYLSQALVYGAKGYLLKNTPSEDIAQAIHLVHRGHTHFSSGLIEQLVPTIAKQNDPKIPQELSALTPRELEVLRLLSQGCSNREIAQQPFITEQTAKNHVSTILRRLNLRDRTQAAIFTLHLQA